MNELASLTLDLQPGEHVRVGDATVRFIAKSGRIARLQVCAPPETKIERVKNTSTATLGSPVPSMAESSPG